MPKGKKKENVASQTFKSTVVLCCMIALCSAAVGALAMYFYMSSQSVNDNCPQVEDSKN